MRKKITACNIKLDKDNYKKHRTICKNCYSKNKRKNNDNTLTQNQQPKIDKVISNNINRILLVGPNFLGKTYLMLKSLSRIPPYRDNFIITKSPPELYSSSKIKIKEIGEEIKPLSEYKNAIIVFDDLLGTSNSKNKDQFFTEGRQNN